LARAPLPPGLSVFTSKYSDKTLNQCKAHKTIRPMLEGSYDYG